MDQCGSLHALCKSDHVLSADYIRAQRTFKSGIEGDVSGTVNHDVDVFGNLLCLLVRVTQVCIADVTAEHYHSVTDETLQSTAIALAQGIERRRRDYAIPKPNLRLFLRARANRHIDSTDIWETIQQHAERYFAHEAGAADQEDLAAVVDFGWRKFHNVFDCRAI